MDPSFFDLLEENPPLQPQLQVECRQSNPLFEEPEFNGEDNPGNAFTGSGRAEEMIHLNMNPIPDLNDPVLNQKKKELTNEERADAYGMLLSQSRLGKKRKGSTREVAELFNVSMKTIQRFWKRGKESRIHDVSKNRVKYCGRKRVQIDLDRIREIPLRQRTTLRSFADALGVSKTFLRKRMKSGELRRHSNAIRPTLTEGNRHRRLQHCLSMIDPSTSDGNNPTFSNMDNIIHIDEKWFQMTRKIQNYYLVADEDDPVRTIKSFNFVPKIMFLAAVARPRYDSQGTCTFDGKIGVFPLVQEVAAIRSSSNRMAGTLELKAIMKIDRQVIRNFMITKILPAIKDKWPRDNIIEPIIIQQDNAKTHIREDDAEFIDAAHTLGLNVKILCQPPNSSDLNVLDLGFFRAIQSLQEKECATNVVQLVEAVEKAFWEFSDKMGNNIFITLQSCMSEVMKILGSNIYKIPHLRKGHKERHSILPSQLSCDPVVVAIANAHCPE